MLGADPSRTGAVEQGRDHIAIDYCCQQPCLLSVDQVPLLAAVIFAMSGRRLRAGVTEQSTLLDDVGDASGHHKFPTGRAGLNLGEHVGREDVQ